MLKLLRELCMKLWLDIASIGRSGSAFTPTMQVKYLEPSLSAADEQAYNENLEDKYGIRN